MKQRIRFISVSALAVTTLLLMGCVNSTPGQSYVVDSDKVYAIEKAAKTSSTNVDVIWVNPPRKRVKID
ncbi:hypothetical protein [Pleionea mediterranea]|uniref:YnbE-like lipoprotein n=1 Tax=Pleionea mediterranea TaxID=523701 RepID=A0A316FYQ9_9GAMM|nr:hypothetical protein [Pleionea mediterranea]PWK53668.1 hypothetical protein C8D97_10256 [Pleionea mediterranea]